MSEDSEDADTSLSDEATFAGRAKPEARDVSLSDEQTLGGGADAAGIDPVMDDIEVVDLEARYTIEGTLGQGGMGAVLLATDTRLGRKVAIKRILGEAARSATAIQRFLTEAKAVAALNHPNVVQIHDYGRAKDGPFLIMEYVDGGSLAEKCKVGALPLEEAIDLACHVCDGLAKAHELGIIHRDIKPANVLLTKDGVPKLTDFGLAKADSSDHQMTMTGAVMGTPDFMSPEQRRDAAEVDSRSDLWSLAATLYQMVTGRSPKVIRLHEVPQSLQAVLAKALEDRKDDRYQTAKEFAAAVRGGGGVVAAPTSALVGGESQDGQCPSCGTINADTTRKFCKKCGESLRVPCLKCETQIPVWDTICGECGGNQPGILRATREKLIAEQVEAASFAADFQFDQAIAIAERIASKSHGALADLAAAARSFVETTSVQRDQQNAAAAALFAEAQEHCNAFDYPSAIHALERIPSGCLAPTMATFLDETRRQHEEASRLLADLTARVKAKELEGLLPIVGRAIELRGDRADLVKLRDQLVQRQAARMSRAETLMRDGNARAAAAMMDGVAATDLPRHRRDFVAKARNLAAIEEEIAALVKSARGDGGLRAATATRLAHRCEEYLAVVPDQPKIQAVLARSRSVLGFENSIGISFKFLLAGSLTMGQAHTRDAKPHRVTLSQDFYLATHPVTEAQWAAVMGGGKGSSNRPVTGVSWDDAVSFCKKLSGLPEEQAAGRVYRLPTEAEWEYACRAGTTTAYSFGDDESLLGEFAWFINNSGGQTHPVGQKKPNAWGLYDMHGSVWEWCSDWYEDYAAVAATDPGGPATGSSRVLRGGSWGNIAGICRSANRNWGSPSSRNDYFGFRLALSPSGE